MNEEELPKIGLGTWMLKPSEAEYSTIEALKIGYRFIDTAQAYGNEKGVGKGLQEIFQSLGLNCEIKMCKSQDNMAILSQKNDMIISDY